jgi:transcriptional regulator of acetoin/glycerol metabolism
VAPAHLPGELRPSAELPHREPEESRGEQPQAAERTRIHAELERQHWHIGKTAAALGVSRNTLYRKLHRYGLMPS